MSTTIHHHPTRPAWTLLPRRPRSPVRALGSALAAALVPGQGRDDVVPALHASDAQALLVRAGELAPERASDRWDRPTADAVAAFQRHRGLPGTGVADGRTADLLLDVHERPEALRAA